MKLAKVPATYSFAGLELDTTARRVTRGSERIPLAPKAFDLLVFLVANPGRVVTKDEILAAVWQDAFVEESNLAQQVRSLRKALDAEANLIVTVPGKGYQLAAQVAVVQAVPSSVPATESGTSAAVLVERERTHLIVEETSEIVFAPARKRSVWLTGSAFAALVLVVLGFLGWQRFGPKPQLRRVLVADFLNLTGDASMDPALRSALAIDLEQSPYIQIMSSGLIEETLSRMEKPATTPLLGDVALEVCKRADYQVALQGRIDHQGYRYDLSLEPKVCATGQSLGVYRAQALTKDAILDGMDSLTRRARSKLGEPSASLRDFGVPLMNATTFSFEALQDYNSGGLLGNAGKIEEALKLFEKAVAIDPNFAMGWDQAGTGWWDLGDLKKANECFKKAYNLTGNLSQREKFMIRYHYDAVVLGDFVEGAKNLEAYTRIYPTDDWGWGALADAYVQSGQFPEAIQAAEHVVKYGTYRPEMIYEVLIRALFRANRFADAKRVIAEAQAQGKDGPHLHHMLYEMALIEHDPGTAQREAQWAKGQPEDSKMRGYEATAAADSGKVQEYEQDIDKALPLVVKEIGGSYADGLLTDEGFFEAEIARNTTALAALSRVTDRSDPNYAISLARAGNPGPAEALLRQKEARPADTLLHFLSFPEMRALVALGHHDSKSAIAALEAARPYELARCEAIEVRADAYLAAGDGLHAELEYRKIIDHPALEDAMHPRAVLAHLGLARAYALEQKSADSRAEYEHFFALWKDADPGIPIVTLARSEYARLN